MNGQNNERRRAEKDFISRLPEDVLIRILSNLETIDAVRTSILSSAWKDLWKKVYNLDFSFPRKVYRKCSLFVNHVVDRLESGNIQSFRLYARFKLHPGASLDEYNCFIDDFPSVCIDDFIPKWTAYAARHNVRELTLDVDCDSFLFPQRFLNCASLVKLSLRTGYFGFDNSDKSSVCFPSLKSLYIYITANQVDDVSLIRKLFHGCPVLEDLTICTEVHQNDMLTFDLSLPSLRTLAIHENYFLFRDNDTPSKFVVEAHNLEYLEISANETFPHLVLADAPYLRKVSLSNKIKCYVEYIDTTEADKTMDLLHAIKHTRCLSLMTGAVAIFGMEFDGNMPIFPHLIDLELAMESFDLVVSNSAELRSAWYDFAKILRHFFRNSPILEALTLELGLPYYHVYNDSSPYEAVGPIKVVWFDSSDFPPGSLTHLKRIQVKNVRQLHELKPVKLLLEHGTNLESFSVGLCGSTSKIEMLQNHILEFPKPSTLGEIQFTYDVKEDDDDENADDEEKDEDNADEEQDEDDINDNDNDDEDEDTDDDDYEDEEEDDDDDYEDEEDDDDDDYEDEDADEDEVNV